MQHDRELQNYQRRQRLAEARQEQHESFLWQALKKAFGGGDAQRLMMRWNASCRHAKRVPGRSEVLCFPVNRRVTSRPPYSRLQGNR